MSNANPKPLIIFDLVSTLTDAGPRYARAFSAVCERHGVEPPAEKEVLKALGNKNLKEIIDEYAPGIDAQEIESFMEDCNATCDAMLKDADWNEHLFPYVRDTLAYLSKAGYALGVYTGTRDDALESQMAYHDIADFFETSLIRAKNNERDGFVPPQDLKAQQLASIIESYRDYLEERGIKVTDDLLKDNVLIIGDSVADIKAAADVGFGFMGFAPTIAKQHAFAAAGVTDIFGDYRDLPDRLDSDCGEDTAYKQTTTLLRQQKP